MLCTTIVDWFCGLRVEDNGKNKHRFFWLWFSILTNIGALFVFKYFNFFLGDTPLAKDLYANQWTAWAIELGKYTIPAGISFYTFQSLSYIIDVYRGDEKAQKNLPRFMLFVSFFPQLVAGPIERFGKLNHQLFQKHSIQWKNISNGSRILLYGLFLKVCVADNLSLVVDDFYSNPAAYGSWGAWQGIIAFAFQVFADFFGYSLLAQGAALVFGIDLMDNFNKPYIAKSVPEFWHRWHISLSTWFRDYVFIPIGGNKKGPWVLAFAVMVVFATSGLWHGANTTMIVFGICQGSLYLFDRFIFSKIKINGMAWDGFRNFKTVMFFALSLVYFRSANMNQTDDVFRLLFSNTAGEENLKYPIYIPIFMLLFLLFDNYIINQRIDKWLDKFSLPIRWTFYAAAIASIWLLGGATNHPFVYFQF